METQFLDSIGNIALNGGLGSVIGLAFYFIVRLYKDLAESNAKHLFQQASQA